jgi:hypothetical protein
MAPWQAFWDCKQVHGYGQHIIMGTAQQSRHAVRAKSSHVATFYITMAPARHELGYHLLTSLYVPGYRLAHLSKDGARR